MSAYKRLTKRDELLQRTYRDECFGCEPTHCATCPINDSVWDKLAELEDKIEQGKLIEFPRVVERKIPIYNERSIDFDKSTTVWDVEEMRPNGCVITRFLFESSAYQRLEELQNGQAEAND